MNTLLGQSARMEFHTDLSAVFRAIGERQREFQWLLTDIECNGLPPALSLLDEPVEKPLLWLKGTQLTQILKEASYPIQFVWGVLSGFRPGVNAKSQPLDTYPFADGNSSLWEPDVHIQHPLAEVEIVCWDSSYTMFLSKDDDLTERFRAYFPESVDLNERNQRTQRERCIS